MRTFLVVMGVIGLAANVCAQLGKAGPDARLPPVGWPFNRTLTPLRARS
jgi:hypothetical protein